MFETAGSIVAFIISVLSMFAIFVKMGSWIKKRRDLKLKQKNEMMTILRSLCSGQEYLDGVLDRVVLRLDNMDSERQKAREQYERERQEDRAEDERVRTRLYYGTVATLDALMRLAEHEGLKINGDIAQYRQENIDNLKHRRGIAD